MNTTQKINSEKTDNENPEWTDDMFSHSRHAADIPSLNKIVKASRGRPKSDKTKKPISIRLSEEVLEYFRATGKGWQTRLDSVLKDYVNSHK